MSKSTLKIVNCYSEEREITLNSNTSLTDFQDLLKSLFPLVKNINSFKPFYFVPEIGTIEINSDDDLKKFKKSKIKCCYLKDEQLEKEILEPKDEAKKQIVELTKNYQESLFNKESSSFLEETKNEFLEGISSMITTLDLLVSQTFKNKAKSILSPLITVFPKSSNDTAHNIVCHLCGLFPIRGSYYLCNKCMNYTICEDCEYRLRRRKEYHSSTHEFYYIYNTNLTSKAIPTQTASQYMREQLKGIDINTEYKVECLNQDELEEITWNYSEKKTFNNKTIKIRYKNIGEKRLQKIFGVDPIVGEQKLNILTTYNVGVPKDIEKDEEFEADIKIATDLDNINNGTYYIMVGIKTGGNETIESSIVTIKINIKVYCEPFSE